MKQLPKKILERFQELESFSSVDDIPIIPQVDDPEEYKIIIDSLIKCGAIPKKKLIVGGIYEGTCRNATIATWNGKCFDYLRYKWGDHFMDTVPHFEDERYSDIFIPFRQLN